MASLSTTYDLIFLRETCSDFDTPTYVRLIMQGEIHESRCIDLEHCDVTK